MLNKRKTKLIATLTLIVFIVLFWVFSFGVYSEGVGYDETRYSGMGYTVEPGIFIRSFQYFMFFNPLYKLCRVASGGHFSACVSTTWVVLTLLRFLVIGAVVALVYSLVENIFNKIK